MDSLRIPAGELSAVYRLDGVTVRYRPRASAVETRALDAVSLTVGRGEFLVVIGASGSGKSTLLQVMAGLVRPDAGHVLFSASPESPGVSLDAAGEDACALLRRRHIGFIYQSFHLLPTMTASDNVGLSLLFGGVPLRERQERSQAVLESIGVGKFATRYPYELSGGEQQRVAIARALAGGPSVLLADEPTGSLDSSSADRVLDLIAQVHDSGKLTTVLVTHDPRVARRIASRVVELRDGGVVGGNGAEAV